MPIADLSPELQSEVVALARKIAREYVDREDVYLYNVRTNVSHNPGCRTGRGSMALTHDDIDLIGQGLVEACRHCHSLEFQDPVQGMRRGEVLR